MDIAIRHTTQKKFSVFSEKLANVSVAPVCAPERADRLKAGESIDTFPRLVLVQTPSVWAIWNQVAERPDLPPRSELLFESLSDGLQAAINGQGLIMAPLALIEHHLKSGQRVMPFSEKVERVSAYHLLCLKGEETSFGLQSRLRKNGFARTKHQTARRHQ